jgi:hypothetical protein
MMEGTDFLDMYTDEMLQKVLDEREEQRQRQKVAIPPKPAPRHTKAAFKRILDAAASQLKFIESEDYSIDNNSATEIFEDVMEAIYGPDIWDYINAFGPE